ncbi:hypothetical protein ACFVFI_38680, partial [Streptomyces sp. NPDC057705]|uniref:hypothetical protein n=1 Tax=Streptomyces sp. NPDC057705 TaxID=3346222 RepID=UPI0036BBF293
MDDRAGGHPGDQVGAAGAFGDALGDGDGQVRPVAVGGFAVGVLVVFEEGAGVVGDVSGGDVVRLVHVDHTYRMTDGG